jgi:hypothetical protein
MKRSGYTARQVERARTALPERVDRREDRELLARFVMTPGELKDRMGSGP